MACRRIVALAALVLLLAAACGGDSGGSSSVRFLVFGDPPEIQAYRTLIRSFERAEPEIDVELVEASDREDLLARLSTSLAGGAPPDLFLMNYRFYGQFAARGVLEPLEPYVNGSDAFELEDFYPQAVDAFRWNGEVTCLPQNISSLVVYFNRDLFKRFKVPPPRNGMFWNEFVARASQMTRDANGLPVVGADPDMPRPNTAQAEVYGLGVEPTIIRLAPFVWSNGGEVVDDEEEPTRFALDSIEAKQVVDAFFQLRTVHGVVPTDQEVESEDDESRFANGRLAMLLGSRRSVPTFREAAKFDWDIVSLPTFREPAGILHSDAYCLTKASDAKDAAWRFVEYALGPEGAPVVARTGRTVPSLRSVAESDAFLDPSKKPANSRIFLDGIEHIRRVPSISTWPEIEDASEGILENGMYLGQPVDEVLADLDEATRPLFERAEN
ncbi:MAG TPA: sugar ABC transporter substrate-binding protein [Gaiellaceae bacterium]|nr:sugar ABC transporter substrate-binding protein [Gaiellaceae bacterium]